MKSLCLTAAVGTFVVGVSPADAQIVQRYVYDGNGRLVRVATDSGATTTETEYALDAADNRSSRITTTTSARSTSNVSVAGQPVAPSPPTNDPVTERKADNGRRDRPAGQAQQGGAR